LPPLGARQTNPLLGVNPNPGPLGQDFYKIPMPGGEIAGFVSELNPLQKNILDILEIPVECYTYEYLFNTD